MTDWKEVQLADVCEKIGSGATPRGGNSVYLESGEYSLIRSQNVYNDRFSLGGLAYISSEHADQLSNVEVEEDDVLLNITGDSVARCCQVPNEILPARVNQHVSIIRPDPQMQDYLLGLAHAGATRKALTKGMIEDLRVPCPEIDTQKRIAGILGSLDDKIELNRRINESLEAMARAVFQSWFVDFDPVLDNALASGHPIPAELKERAARRKQQKNKLLLPKEIKNLFPDSFINSPLGPIPKGWSQISLNDIIDFVIGGDWGKEEPQEEFICPAYCIRGADIPDLMKAALGKTPIRYFKKSNLETRSLKDGDIVFEISGGSPTQQTGRAVYISEGLLRRLDVPIICTNFCRLVRIRENIPSIYIVMWLRWLYTNDVFWQYESGTTGIKNFAFKAFIANYPLILPPVEILNEFLSKIKILFAKRDQNGVENETLTHLRDTLLPKLLTGEIEV